MKAGHVLFSSFERELFIEQYSRQQCLRRLSLVEPEIGTTVTITSNPHIQAHRGM